MMHGPDVDTQRVASARVGGAEQQRAVVDEVRHALAQRAPLRQARRRLLYYIISFPHSNITFYHIHF
jgi:hypothetical protein